MKITLYRIFFFLFTLTEIASASVPRHASGRVFTHGIWHRDGYRFADGSIHPLSKTNDDSYYKPLPVVRQDFLVNTDLGTAGADQMNVSIARGDDGFLCAWIDERSGQRRIEGQLFSDQGRMVGQPIHISDRYNSWNSQPNVAFNPVTKEYIVTWAESGFDVQMQRISAGGVRIGTNFIVNDISLINTNNPAAAVTPNGSIIVTWESDENFQQMRSAAYHKILNRDGSPKMMQQKTMTREGASVSSQGWDARIAADSTGTAVIVWSEYAGNHSRIFAQTIDSSGHLIAANIIVSDSTDTLNHWFPTIASTRDGHFLIVWETDKGISGSIFNRATRSVSPQFAIENTGSTWNMYSASSDEQGIFFVSYNRWSGEQNGECIAEIPASGGPIVYHSGLSGTPPDIGWYYTKLTAMKDGIMHLAYFKYDRIEQNVYVRIYDRAFAQIAGPVNCALDAGSSSQMMPAVAFNTTGRSIVVWEDQKNGNHDLCARVYDEQGAAAGPILSVNDTATASWASDASVAADNLGNFIVSFAAGDYSTRSLFVRRISSAGALLGAATKVAGPFYYYSGLLNCLCQESGGTIHVAWSDNNTYAPACYRQKFTTELKRLGGQDTLMKVSQNDPKIMFDLSFNSRGDVAILWTGYNTTEYYPDKFVKASVYDNAGRMVMDTITLHLALPTMYYRSAKCKLDDERNIAAMWLQGATDNYYSEQLVVVRRYTNGRPLNFFSSEMFLREPMLRVVDFRNRSSIVSWSDGWQIKGLFFNDFTQEVMPLELKVFDTVVDRLWDGNPGFSAAVSGDKLLLAYTDQKQWERGLDIYANVQNIASLAFGWENTTGMVEVLSEPYPNPAGSQSPVALRYELRYASNVDIGVYNILGQKVADLVHGRHEPGMYHVRFDPHSLPTGVYFFRYAGGRVYTRKFLHVK